MFQLVYFIYLFSAFVGFIDFIVEPTFSLLTDSTEKIITPLIEEASKTETASYGSSRFGIFSFFASYFIFVMFNNLLWLSSLSLIARLEILRIIR